MTDERSDDEDWQMRAQAAEAELAKVKAEADERLIRAQLKAEALRVGMLDLDGLKLLDLRDVKLTEAGEVADAAMLLSNMKRSKPWLFGNTATSSSTVNPPRPEAARVRHANELSHDEWVAARAALMRRR